MLIVLLLSALSKSAYAITSPTFPACANPKGKIVATYDSGTHGVAGDTSSFTGKDTVYSLSEGTLTQCLCTNNGDGIQTNWWKVSSLTKEEKNILIKDGWILISDGSAWGLEAAPYLAKNSSYVCIGTNTSDSGSRNSNIKSDKKDGAVLGISTGEVLGLASTGNIAFILGVLFIGLSMFLTGLILNIKRNK